MMTVASCRYEPVTSTLQCVPDSTTVDGDRDGTSDCGSEAAVFFPSIRGLMYYILVYGSGAPSQETGEFGLEIREPTINDDCGTALPIRTGHLVTGTTENARASYVFECGNASNAEAPGVWYKVMGSGTSLEAEVCQEGDLRAFFQITILQGDCNTKDWTCIAGEKQCYSCSCLLVQWDSNLEELYYVFVHGFRRPQEGQFSLEVRSIDQVP